MSKQFEELSKNLASGISRRKAFGRFAAGIGAVCGGLLLRKPAQAGGIGIVPECLHYCRDRLHLTGEKLIQCTTQCYRGLLVNQP